MRRYFFDRRTEPMVFANGSKRHLTPAPFSEIACIMDCPCEDNLLRRVEATGSASSMQTVPGVTYVNHKGKRVAVSGVLHYTEGGYGGKLQGWTFVVNRGKVNADAIPDLSALTKHIKRGGSAAIIKKSGRMVAIEWCDDFGNFILPPPFKTTELDGDFPKEGDLPTTPCGPFAIDDPRFSLIPSRVMG